MSPSSNKLIVNTSLTFLPWSTLSACPETGRDYLPNLLLLVGIREHAHGLRSSPVRQLIILVGYILPLTTHSSTVCAPVSHDGSSGQTTTVSLSPCDHRTLAIRQHRWRMAILSGVRRAASVFMDHRSSPVPHWALERRHAAAFGERIDTWAPHADIGSTARRLHQHEKPQLRSPVSTTS